VVALRQFARQPEFSSADGKHGLKIRYFDQHGKKREQVYEILRENGKEVVNDPRLANAS
jgi:hypothetical protein